MDWMTKLEEEDKRKAAVAREVSARYTKESQERSAKFEPFVRCLQPVFEERKAQVASRLGIALDLKIGYFEIIVRAPKPPSQDIDEDFPFSFTISNCDGKSADVVAEEVRRVRHYYHDGSSELSGSKVILLDVRATIDQLLSGDFERLMEWLVAS